MAADAGATRPLRPSSFLPPRDPRSESMVRIHPGLPSSTTKPAIRRALSLQQDGRPNVPHPNSSVMPDRSIPEMPATSCAMENGNLFRRTLFLHPTSALLCPYRHDRPPDTPLLDSPTGDLDWRSTCCCSASRGGAFSASRGTRSTMPTWSRTEVLKRSGAFVLS